MTGTLRRLGALAAPALVLLLLLTAGPAAAKLDELCGVSSIFNEDVARVCDSSDVSRDVVLRFTSRGGTTSSRLQRSDTFTDVAGAEPLMPGERVDLTWKRIGPKARLVVDVAQPLRGSRTVRFPLRAADHRTSVRVAANGTITVVRGSRTSAQPEAPLAAGESGGPPVVWTASTPAQAVRAAVRALRLSTPAALGVFCAGLEPDVSAGYGVVFADHWGPYAGDPGCGAYFDFELFVAENTPTSLGTTGTVRSTRTISPTEAIVRVRLHHRYATYSRGDQSDARVTADVLVVRTDGSTPWRIATPESLLPVPIPRTAWLPHTLAALRQARARVLKEARGYTRKLAAAWAPFDSAGVPIAPVVAPCPTGATTPLSDAAADLRAWGREPTRDPSPLGADLLAGALTGRGPSGLCLAVRLAEPVAKAFTLDLRLGDQQGSLSVHDGRALLVKGSADEEGDSRGTPVAGIQVGRSAGTFVVHVPAGSFTTAAGAAWSVSSEAYGRYDQLMDDAMPDEHVVPLTSAPSTSAARARLVARVGS